MKIRIFALLLALVMCFTLASCNSGTSGEESKKNDDVTENSEITEDETTKEEPEDTKKTDEESKVTPILYKVTDSDGDVVWLFGSVHVGREDFFPLPDYVLNAFDESDALALEFDLVAFEKDMSAQMKALQPMLYLDGTTIKDHIPEDMYNSAVQIMKENNIYNIALDYYIPVMWESMVSQCVYNKLDVDIGLGIDRHLINRAYKNDKEIFDIESAEYQYGVLAGFSEELQITLLEGAIEGYGMVDEAKIMIDSMLDAWALGDAEELLRTVSEEAPEDPYEQLLYEEYNNALVTERNNSMTEYAVDALESGDEIFICVGAAHIVGDGAMADQLAELGYTVELVD